MDPKELESMRKSFKTVENKQNLLKNNPQILKFKEEVQEIKKNTINRNKELQEIAINSFKRNDINVLFASDGKQARDIIFDIISQEDETIIAKSKSNTLGEIGVSKYLGDSRIEVVETDLGDRILQLKENNNKPTHPTGPASHLNVAQITEIINNSMNLNIKANAKDIMEVVKKDVKEKIAKCNIGLSGANAIAADEGSLVFIHNEGNISLLSLLKIHIVVVGIDKIVNNIEEAIKIAKLETAYATGSLITSYINIVSGPSKTADIEKILLKNMYGAEKVVLILLDNGRVEAIENAKECMWCIGCGSCIVTCPVYSAIGNDFGFNNYLGGRGVVMSKFIEDSKTSFDSGLYKCTLCGLCTLNCPVSIPTSQVMEKIREMSNNEDLSINNHETIKENIKNKGSPY
ncbi:LUD domain-containing protein [Methanobrevibacter filiformis]|uniref:Lactate utilization protein B n=1 Tax=Methanobrevibacter filiformis TaxID=55758 RepID=A0A166DLW3_9EURY|nr:LUD domain-containing protein [Methanobrevibacter filiformis]KZX15735.1 lactate utilization protein B [Methanobrevibacter filiformis]